MRGVKVVRTDLKCEHGPVGEAYASSKACTACACARSGVQGKKKRRQRDPEKSRKYYKDWYKRNAHHFNAARRAAAGSRPKEVVCHLNAEIREIRALGVLARGWARKFRMDPARRFATRWLSGGGRRASCDFDAEWLAGVLRKAVAAGAVVLERGRPETASVDQVIAGLGYRKANVQVVPLWYNFAKAQWLEPDVEAAIKKWCIAKSVRG